MKTPRRLLAFENRTADSRLDNLSSPVSACTKTVGLGLVLPFLPHRDVKKTGSKGKNGMEQQTTVINSKVKNSCFFVLTIWLLPIQRSTDVW